MKRHWMLLIAAIIITFQATAQMPIEDELYAYVLGIEGRSHFGRGEFIKDQLRKLSTGYVSAPFKKIVREGTDTLIIEGENIIVRIGKGTKRIVVGAHYDAAPDSPGANDNGSGVAVMLALINHMQEMEWNYAVDFCFFDQEENGTVGSIYYIKQFMIPKKHFVMINLDVEGSGEEIFAGPVGSSNRLVIRYVHEAVQKTGFPFVERTEFPASDQESFAKLQLENIGISVVPKGDGDRLSKFVRQGYKSDSLDSPRVMSVMHTVDDRSNAISQASLKMSYEFTKTLLLLLNESRK
jgi:hypothetical protein